MAADKRAFHTNEEWSSWLDKLAANDYVVVDDFLSETFYREIRDYFERLLEEREFDKAAIGSSGQRQVESNIRGDFIYWLDREADSEISDLFDLFDEVLRNLRQQLFLSLSDYEFHFALYPPETRYKKHVDQFHGSTNRIISMLIYLNENWKAGDGGELKIYGANGKETLVEPLARRLVMFKSATVEHEVMITRTRRRSITGWLLRQPATLAHLA